MNTSPDVGRPKPAIILSSVVLPEPDGPRMVRKRPFSRSNVASRTACTPSNTMLTSRTDTANGASAAIVSVIPLLSDPFNPSVSAPPDA